MTIPPRSRAALPRIARTPCRDASVSSYGLYRLGTGHQKGSSGFCVGALQIPPLCKGRQGGVEASRGWTSGGALVRVSRPDLYLPAPLPPTVTIGGRGLPWEPPTSFQEPTRFPEEPKRVDSTILHVREVEHLSVKQERRLLWP